MDYILEQAAATLRQIPGVDEWAIRRNRSRSHQLFTVGSEPEAMRKVQTDRLAVEVFADHDGRRGDSAFVVNAGDLDQLATGAKRAAFAAALVSNRPYRLPASPSAEYAPLELVDQQMAADPTAVAQQMVAEITQAVAASPETRLSSIEIFLNYNEHELLTSTGASGSYAATTLTLDLALLTGPSGDDAESYLLTSRRRLTDLSLTELVQRQARHAADSLRAILPSTGSYPLVFSDDALAELFNPFLYRASAAAKYRSLSPLEIGQRVTVGDLCGTSLNLTLDATLPFGLRSLPFDDLGVAAQSLPLIVGDRLQNFSANQRYASYLDLPATGPVGNIVLPAGDVSLADLLCPHDGILYHVVAFSSFEPDAVSGDFVAEIRLGYEVRPDGSRRPVRGGAVSGNVFIAFANASFSRETVFTGDYSGPAAVRLEGITIAGE